MDNRPCYNIILSTFNWGVVDPLFVIYKLIRRYKFSGILIKNSELSVVQSPQANTTGNSRDMMSSVLVHTMTAFSNAL